MDESDDGIYGYKWQSITLEPGIWSYDAIVSAIVDAKYPIDKMQAIQNNFALVTLNLLGEDEAKEVTSEMLEMQSWRSKAKEIAKDALAADAPEI